MTTIFLGNKTGGTRPSPASRTTAAKALLALLLAVFALSGMISCAPTPENPTSSHQLPPIFPDYADVTIPRNIAPLNFLLRGDYDAVEATVRGGGDELRVNSGSNEVVFNLEEWKKLLEKAAGDSLEVCVTARKGNGQWVAFRPFHWTVANDSIDPYLTYRLIEPDYEVFGNLTINERCLENFDERPICDHNLVGHRCMNCHTYGNQDPALSMLYVRGEGGGAILNRNGTLRKLGLKTDSMVSGSVYAQFSPSGRYLVFSTNVIIPAFHSKPDKRLEVFDSASDVYVADLESNTVIGSSLLSDSLHLETFPTFSPDGRHIYYCTAPLSQLRQGVEHLQYSLCRIDFDEKTGTIGNVVDTLRVTTTKHSVCHPRVSPDGKWLLYTVADYGTFPIWHPETDLQMMNLSTGHTDSLAIVNSQKSDTYHSWASNSRWFVFASKRDDGLYGRPYFCHVAPDGRVSKPFVLPQRHPKFYDNFLKSFNIPELGRGKLPFTGHDVMRKMRQEAESFK